ncbi:MAG: NRDE family protein, partial [Pseudomonadota bacterium]
MCLIVLGWKQQPDCPLIVAANRDEFHRRPTAALDFWPDAPQVLAGRDLQSGGSWMGVSRSGRFAALTNYRDPSTQRADTRSRGELVARFLTGRQTADEY